MKQYIIDGYNLLFSFLEDQEDIETSRKEMISSLGELLQDQSYEFLVVFDSSPNNAWQFEYQTPLKIIFSPSNISADQYILEIIRGAKAPDTIIVVTSDKHLASESRGLGASTQTLALFLRKIRKKKSIEKKPDHTASSEFRRWQKIFEKRMKEQND